MLLAGLVAVTTVGLDAAGLPSPDLFAGLVVGLAYALLARDELRLPGWTGTAAQGVIGVVMGTLVQPDTLRPLAGYWLPVTLITLATLLLTVLAGLLLARFTTLGRTTAIFGMIAGGASGIVAISDELGADGRYVAVLQYLRLLLIVVLMPVAVVVIFGTDGRQGDLGAGSGPAGPWPVAVLGVIVLALVGTWVARVLRVPAPSLLGPMVLAAALTAAGIEVVPSVPVLLTSAAFAVVGAEVGLRFTPETLRTLRRILPAGLFLIVSLIVLCGGLGVLLSVMTGLTPLDGYLATTPGGIFVVLAVAAGADANSTVVVAVQVLRMLVMLLAGPALARLLSGRDGGPDR